MNLLEVLGAVRDAASTPSAFAVIGAVARNAWAPPRATTDLDRNHIERWARFWNIEDRLHRLRDSLGD